MNKTILCPILNKEIENEICFDISMVAENLAPEYTAPQEVTEVKDFSDICLNCKNHKE